MKIQSLWYCAMQTISTTNTSSYAKTTTTANERQFICKFQQQIRRRQIKTQSTMREKRTNETAMLWAIVINNNLLSRKNNNRFFQHIFQQHTNKLLDKT